MTDHLGLADHEPVRNSRDRPRPGRTDTSSRHDDDINAARAAEIAITIAAAGVAGALTVTMALQANVSTAGLRSSRRRRLRRNSPTRRWPEGGQLAVGTRWGASTGRPTVLRGYAERRRLTAPTAGLRQPVVELHA